MGRSLDRFQYFPPLRPIGQVRVWFFIIIRWPEENSCGLNKPKLKKNIIFIMQSNTITSKCFLCGAAPAFRVFVPHSLVCAEKGPGGQWAAEWCVQWRPTSLAASTEYVLLEEQPYILSRFVELESAAGDGEVGGKWWGGLVARWLTYNCSMPVSRAWHSLSVFVLFFFLTSSPLHPLHLPRRLPSPLPRSTLPSIHLSSSPHCWSADNKTEKKNTKQGEWQRILQYPSTTY